MSNIKQIKRCYIYLKYRFESCFDGVNFDDERCKIIRRRMRFVIDRFYTITFRNSSSFIMRNKSALESICKELNSLRMKFNNPEMLKSKLYRKSLKYSFDLIYNAIGSEIKSLC